MTLKKSEKGFLEPIEQISKPMSTLKETDFKTNQPSVSHYPWDSSKFPFLIFNFFLLFYFNYNLLI